MAVSPEQQKQKSDRNLHTEWVDEPTSEALAFFKRAQALTAKLEAQKGSKST